MLSIAHGSASPNPGLPIKDGYHKHVCVYAICKNEAHNVERFSSWALEADGIFCLDTGSTDGTQELLRRHRMNVASYQVHPWRFDEAKNRALALVPDDADICICFNLDEAMDPPSGWRRHLESLWGPGAGQAKYRYFPRSRSESSGNFVFWFSAIHSRRGYVWRYPTHEVLWGIPGQCGETVITSLACYHERPRWKEKSDDLALLRLALQEEPHDERCLHYYGRELFYRRRWRQARAPLLKHLQASRWGKEKAASANMLAGCAERLGRPGEAERWYLRAVSEAPEMREHWVYLGRFYANRCANYAGGYYCGKQALAIPDQDLGHYYCNEMDWSFGPWDILSVCAWYLGLRNEARDAIKKAVALAPYDSRVQSNYRRIIAG